MFLQSLNVEEYVMTFNYIANRRWDDLTEHRFQIVPKQNIP